MRVLDLTEEVRMVLQGVVRVLKEVVVFLCDISSWKKYNYEETVVAKNTDCQQANRTQSAQSVVM